MLIQSDSVSNQTMPAALTKFTPVTAVALDAASFHGTKEAAWRRRGIG